MARKSLRISAKTFFLFLRSPAFGRKICDFGQKKPSHFGENLCPPDFNFAPRSREAGNAPGLIASCRNKPDNDQGTRDVIERTFIHLQPESIQNILKEQNFVSLHDLGNFTNRFHGQINSQNLGENVTSSSKNLAHVLTNKMDELCTEMHNVKNQVKKPQTSLDQRPRNQNRRGFQHSGRQFGHERKRFNHFPVKNPSQQRPFNKTGFCYYPARFGNRAFKCETPCSFQASKDHSVSIINSGNTVSLAPEIKLPKVYDKLSKRLFLVDSGACANFSPVSDCTHSNEIQSQFVDASANPIKCFGTTKLDIDIGFGKMTDVFHICAIEQPILGFDFLKSNSITLNASACTLKCGNDVNQISASQTSINSIDSLPKHESKYIQLLQNYPELTSPPNYRKPVKHKIVHHLPTKGRPPNIKTRRVSPENYKKIKQQIEDMLESGLIVPSNSEFGSPLHVVPKANTSELRLVGDYKILNKMLTPDRYPLPNLRTAYELLYGSKLFPRSI